MNKIGLLAGVGKLPVEFARAARGMGFHVIGIGLLPEVDPQLREEVAVYHQIHIAKLGSIFDVLQKEQVKQVTMLGKVTKELVYSHKILPDFRVLKIFAGLKDFNDDTLTMGLVKELADAGITVLDQTVLLRRLMPTAGPLTRRHPSSSELVDMKFGLQIAKQIGGLDIGQTVVVKNRAVLAVEAIEGTDACIRRGGALGGGGVIVAKAAKLRQDYRFDMPSVGPDTIRVMIETGATALVIEADKTLVVEQLMTVRMADDNGIALFALADDSVTSDV